MLTGGKPSKLTIQARNRAPSPGVGICLKAESSGLTPEEVKGWLERLRKVYQGTVQVQRPVRDLWKR